MRHVRPRLLALFALGLAVGYDRPAWALTPPWYVLWDKIQATIGVTPGVKVADLIEEGTGYTGIIHVQDVARAEAVASILPPSYALGNVQVTVRVIGPDGKPVPPATPKTAEQLAGFLKTALKENPAFAHVVVKPGTGGVHVIYPVFTRSVVQVGNGDLSDLYGDFNGVTAHVYAELLLEKPGGFKIHPATVH